MHSYPPRWNAAGCWTPCCSNRSSYDDATGDGAVRGDNTQSDMERGFTDPTDCLPWPSPPCCRATSFPSERTLWDFLRPSGIPPRKWKCIFAYFRLPRERRIETRWLRLQHCTALSVAVEAVYQLVRCMEPYRGASRTQPRQGQEICDARRTRY